MKNILKSGMRIDKRFRHADYVNHVGQDIVIKITPMEIKMGSTAIIEVPARMKCPVCDGHKTTCYRCKGYGYVKTVEKVRYSIPFHAKDGELYEWNLGRASIDGHIHLRVNKFRVKIVII